MTDDAPLSPWAAVAMAWERWLAAVARDPDCMEPVTKEAARVYRNARAHANAVARDAKPDRLRSGQSDGS